MDNEEVQGVKFSEFSSAIPDNTDEVVGLHSGRNARFSIANFILAIRQGLISIFVPLTRTINGKALSSDITLDASDVGAVDTADVGVADGVASLDNTGKVPPTQLPSIPSDATDIDYDNTQSGLTATDVQAAIDEVVDDVDGKQDAITANGILKGDGQGGVSAAVAGTDYASASDVASLDERYTDNTIWRMNTDANAYKTSGLYAMATGNANIPAPWGILFVQGAISDTIEQEYRREGYIWHREFRNNTWSSWKDTAPTSELIGVGHTLFRQGKLRILKVEGFYAGQAVITIPVADRPTSTTSGIATFNDSNSASMTVGFVTINTDGSIVYQSWSGYNSNSISTISNRWVACSGVIWMTA